MSMMNNPLPGVPAVESPLFEKIFTADKVSAEMLDIANKLRTDGYAVIDFPDPDFEKRASNIIRTLDSRYDWQGWHSGAIPNLRVQDAWRDVPDVKEIACNARILKLLGDLYGRQAFAFQTLNFPVGTEQHFHSDSVHFSSHPERFMAGVWVALEDIDADNGPLVYYPGSHKMPVFTNEHIGASPDWPTLNPHGHYPRYSKAWEEIVDSLDLKPLYFHAKKGQALIWSANLLHGGAAQRDRNRTRYSQVTHYYFHGCCYYTPIGSLPFLGSIQFRDTIDIATGRPVPNVLNGKEVPKKFIEQATVEMSRQTPSRLPEDFDPSGYLKANPDVAAAGWNPAKHWMKFGYREGRRWR
jgi:phytanoyl-CoA dioxygenase PhyH